MTNTAQTKCAATKALYAQLKAITEQSIGSSKAKTGKINKHNKPKQSRQNEIGGLAHDAQGRLFIEYSIYRFTASDCDACPKWF